MVMPHLQFVRSRNILELSANASESAMGDDQNRDPQEHRQNDTTHAKLPTFTTPDPIRLHNAAQGRRFRHVTLFC